jgi:phosphopantetheine adenylyltransferase
MLLLYHRKDVKAKKEKAIKDAERRRKKYEERMKKERDKEEKRIKKVEKEIGNKIESDTPIPTVPNRLEIDSRNVKFIKILSLSTF